jgi:SAM-dependent methyltransferase
MPPRRAPEPWFVTAFARPYLRVYARRGEEEAREHATPIVRLLGVHPGDRLLDVACGAGRYARALARCGMRVTGVDLSADLIAEARVRSPALPGSPSYVRADARELPFVAQFEAAVSLFTSLGYFDDRDDDRRLLAGVARALVPGGRLLVDYLNATHVRRTLVAASEEVVDDLLVRSERRIDEDAPDGPCVRKRVHAEHAATGRPVAAWEERVRLYERADLEALLALAGFAPAGEPRGDLLGLPFSPIAPRLVLVARVPGRLR